MSLAPINATLTAERARQITDEIKDHTEAVWSLLLIAQEGKAWKALGYDDWASYVGGEFNLSRSRSYQILDQAKVIRELESVVSTSVDISEAAARDLKPVLGAVISDLQSVVADLGPSPDADEVRDAVADVVKAHRKPSNLTEFVETFPDLKHYIEAGQAMVALRLGKALVAMGEDAQAAELERIRAEIAADSMEVDVATGEITEPSSDVTDYLNTDRELQDRKYLTAFVRAMQDGWLEFDPERIAAIATPDVLRQIELRAASVARFADTVKRSQPGLRAL